MLAEDLTIEDLRNKIISIKTYTDNVKRYSYQMKAFLPLFKDNFSLPIKLDKYQGKICYIQYILRSDELYLSLNVTYYKTGMIKSVEAVSQQLAIVELGDMRNIRTLNGKRFKRKYVHDRLIPVYTVIADRIISPSPFRIIENGMEHFASRDKTIRKYDLQAVV